MFMGLEAVPVTTAAVVAAPAVTIDTTRSQSLSMVIVAAMLKAPQSSQPVAATLKAGLRSPP